MNIRKSIRSDIARLQSDTAAVIKQWDTVLYNAGWPCSDNLSPGDRLELAQTAQRLTNLKVAYRILLYASK